MKKNIYLMILSISLFIITSCATKVPLDQSFYNQEKVGVIIEVDSINRFKNGMQGLLDMAISSGAKYKGALQYVGTQVDPHSYFKASVENKFQDKNKVYVLIEDKINFKDLPKFDKSENNSKLKYYSKDLSILKEKYGINQLMIINVKYGLTLSYYGVIETGRSASTYVTSQIINLNNNSILFKNDFQELEVIKGKWNEPPYYEKLKQPIEKTVKNSSEKLKNSL